MASHHSSDVVTLLEICRVRWGIKPLELARESRYSRAHLHRVRMGDIEPSRDCIAAIVSAFRRLTLQDIEAQDVFAPKTESSVSWREQRRHGESFHDPLFKLTDGLSRRVLLK